MTVSFTKVARTAALAFAIAAGAAVLAAGTASAHTDHGHGSGGSGSGSGSGYTNNDELPGGVPVHGTVQAATGATKVLPGPGSSGSGY